MSYFNEIRPAPQPQPRAIGSSIRSATGLSRTALAALYRRDGLFGRDSDLSPAEQAIVQNRIGAIPGVAPRPATTWLTPRLRALAAYVEALIAGRDTRSERERLVRAGFSTAALSEVRTVVEDVYEVFGVLLAPAPAAAVSEFSFDPEYAHAE